MSDLRAKQIADSVLHQVKATRDLMSDIVDSPGGKRELLGAAALLLLALEQIERMSPLEIMEEDEELGEGGGA